MIKNIDINVLATTIGNIPGAILLLMIGNRDLAAGYVGGVVTVLLGLYIGHVFLKKSNK